MNREKSIEEIAGQVQCPKGFGHRFILGETRLYNLLLLDNRLRRALGVRASTELSRGPRSNAQSSRPEVSKTFRGAGLSSSTSESVKRSGCALKRCRVLNVSSQSLRNCARPETSIFQTTLNAWRTILPTARSRFPLAIHIIATVLFVCICVKS